MAPAKQDAVLKEVTNAPEGIAQHSDAVAARAIFKQRPDTVKTFSRKKRVDQVVPQRTDCTQDLETKIYDGEDSSCARVDTGGDAVRHGTAVSITDVYSAASDSDSGDSDSGDDGCTSPPTPQLASGAGRYPRKVPAPAAQRKADADAHFLASMRAHFEQVDAFELAVETPSPAAPQRRQQSPPTAEAAPAADSEALTSMSAAAADVQDSGVQASAARCPPRNHSSSFGLSRRRSSVVSHMPPPRRYSILGAQEEASVAPPMAAAEAQQPAAPAARSSLSGRLSIEAGLSRLSLGFNSALQRFGLRSSGIGAQPEAAADDTHQLPAVSPIAESPEAQSDGTPSTAGPAADGAATAAANPTLAPAATPVPAEGAKDGNEAFHSPAPLPDLRAPDEELYCSPEPQSAGSPSAADPAPQSPMQSPAAASPAAAAPAAACAAAIAAIDEAAVAVAPGAADAEQAAAQLAAVSLVAGPEEAEEAAARVEEPPLQQLLRLCGQPADVLALPSMTELLEEHVDLDSIAKVGEGTFGEAFKAEGVVFKIVPMEGSIPVNGEQQKCAGDILAEVDISLRLSRLRGEPGAPPAANITAGFVQTHGVGVCRGRYAPALRREWHAWDGLNESENDAPEMFQDDQLYIVFVVADGGSDLEHFELRTLAEAKSILLQVALTVGVAEEACQFEHRDLHWGNLLIRRGAPAAAAFRFRGVETKAKTGGLAVTLIDFTLSRVTMPGGAVAFCDLSADPELFAGPKGDCQADTYRRMAKLTKGDWAAHTPATNAAWLAYLADAVLTLKAVPMSAQDKRHLRAFRKRALASDSCAELVFDQYFEGLWSVK